MRVTGVPSLWDEDETGSENGTPAGKVKYRARGVLVTERDLAVLRWLGEQFAVRSDVIRWLLGGDRPLSEGRTRQVIDRWRRARLVHQQRFFLGAEPMVWPTREGLRLVLDDYRARTPALSMLAHIHAVSLVRFGLERRSAAQGWVPERALYRARSSPDVHVADGEYTDPSGRRTAVEVELTVKAAERLRRIIGDLTLEYDRVVYVTGDARVAAAVRGAVHALARPTGSNSSTSPPSRCLGRSHEPAGRDPAGGTGFRPVPNAHPRRRGRCGARRLPARLDRRRPLGRGHRKRRLAALARTRSRWRPHWPGRPRRRLGRLPAHHRLVLGPRAIPPPVPARRDAGARPARRGRRHPRRSPPSDLHASPQRARSHPPLPPTQPGPA